MATRWSLSARTDLENIWNFVADRNPERADRILSSIIRATRRLRPFPYVGRPGAAPGTRELTVSGLPHVVIYEVDERRNVRILRVHDGRSDWWTKTD